jgi:hypothetical protein
MYQDEAYCSTIGKQESKPLEEIVKGLRGMSTWSKTTAMTTIKSCCINLNLFKDPEH